MTSVIPVPPFNSLVSLPLKLSEGLIMLVTVLPIVLVMDLAMLLATGRLELVEVPLVALLPVLELDPVEVVLVAPLVLSALSVLLDIELLVNLPLNLVSVVLSLLLEKRDLLGLNPLLATIGSFRRRVCCSYVG